MPDSEIRMSCTPLFIESIKSPHTVRRMLPLSSYKTVSRSQSVDLFYKVAKMSKMPVFCVLINDTF